MLYVSLHEWPLYPGTGALTTPAAARAAASPSTSRCPPAPPATSTAGPLDDLVLPAAEAHGRPGCWSRPASTPTAPTRSPGSGSRAGDFADLTGDLLAAGAGRARLLFLEGGYDLDGLAASTGAALARVLDVDHRPEPPTAGGPGRDVVAAAARSPPPARPDRRGATWPAA